MTQDAHKQPQIDPAEENAFFPSAYSLSQFTSPVSDLSRADYPKRYTGSQKILVIAADERYLPTDSGALFSTGNHPVETLLPLYHLRAAGFDFDVATLSGQMAKFEYWAMPREDEHIMPFFRETLPKFRNPQKLSDVVSRLTKDSEYAAVFIPGGHGALIGLPASEEVATTLRWAMQTERVVISLCHGPAAFLSLRQGDNPLRGYSVCAFPDSADKETPAMGYMPGHLTWYFGDALKKMGMIIVNNDIKGTVHKDRNVLTGDSPFAANALGQLAAKEMLARFVG
ncbi:protein deglycase HchA [Klebsiella variicola]|uniref:glyoxalase III HchA n=1 Tax=Klebsiella variicola TaxID=244366 RepID=UPI001C7FD17B|nr:glyoxalase III HchA [Klebsiella variicola]MBX4609863.1 protein deglycase HchA [Klebsiella variicola]